MKAERAARDAEIAKKIGDTIKPEGEEEGGLGGSEWARNTAKPVMREPVEEKKEGQTGFGRGPPRNRDERPEGTGFGRGPPRNRDDRPEPSDSGFGGFRSNNAGKRPTFTNSNKDKKPEPKEGGGPGGGTGFGGFRSNKTAKK
jgi:hypothetical protein